VVTLRATYALTNHLELFGRIENALGARYATFGVLGDPTGAGAPGVPKTGIGVDPRFESPATPLAASFGLKATL
jgi:hypothetical protein